MADARERPILFSGPMVRAILDGRKTQTRRVLDGRGCSIDELDDGRLWPWVASADGWLECPYGRPGDRLWVRETWAWGLQEPAVGIGAGVTNHRTGVAYRADGAMPASFAGDRWRPSIHMPRWACRIVLEVTAVRVERLQKISRGDAMLEGCPFPNMARGDDPRAWFAGLWESTYGHESWAANPWVWVVSFRRVEEAARG